MLEPYYEDGLVALYHGDLMEILPLLEPVDLVFTSPPYNLGVSTGGGLTARSSWSRSALLNDGYAEHDDAMEPAAYAHWQQTVLRLCWDGLTDRGAIFYNHKPRVQNKRLWTPLVLNPGLPVRQIIVWARAGGMNYAPSHYCPTHEWIVVFAREDFALKNRAASGVGDVWRIPQDGDNPHPASFPVGLPAQAIETVAPATVLDPFAGSGTTLRAAKDAGVRAIGIELSERYCEMATRRLAQGSLFEEAA